MSYQMSLWDTPNATSSLASACGAMHFVEQDGPTIVRSGPHPALASLSARQAKALGLLTSGTCGPTSTTSSASAVLESSLVNRLRAKTQTLGSTLYTLTWKPWVMPSGRLRSRLRASVRRTSEIARTGWPTPQARDHKGANSAGNDLTHNARPLNEVARLAGWPTTTSTDALRQPAIEATTPNITLNHAVNLAGWPTARAADGEKNVRTLDGALSEIARKGSPQDLSMAAVLCEPVRRTVSGEMLTGSCAGMESGGQLSPAHSRWLMGLPPAWDGCAVTAMQSMQRPQKRSSKL